MSRTPQEQLVHFLSDMYSVEQQALAQLVSAPDIAGEASLAAEFRQHHGETERQAELVRERLEALGGSPSALKDAIMKLGGKGFLLFARTMPETPGRLVVHSYSYEAMEWAGYELLRRFAERAGDTATIEAARSIGAEERLMMQRLERGFDAAERAAHASLKPDDLPQHIVRHLAEVHAFERQTEQLLQRGEKIVGSSAVHGLYLRHLEEIRRHARLVEERLQQLDASRSVIEDAALTLGGLNWGFFFQAQSDTPAKLAAFVYAVYHLEIGGYEMLMRSAARAGDAQTQTLCQSVLGDKRLMAQQLAETFDAAVEATLMELRK